MRLLPQYVKSEISWLPYVWLVWLLYFVADPFLNRASIGRITVTLVATCVFLALYFRAYWAIGKQKLWTIGGMALLGIIFTPQNFGASAFFIYAAATAGFIGGTGLAIAIILTLEAIFGTIVWVFHVPLAAWIPIGILIAAIGVMNIQYAKRIFANARLRMAQEEIEHLAKTAERERIARDLHDVLGHTLSVIILKSELASRLADKDPQRAIQEIRDVERISREALGEVRSALKGYRPAGLDAEVAQARATLETAGVKVQASGVFGNVNLNAAQEGVLALVIREAVTNILRHSQATECGLRLLQTDGVCTLEVADNGCGSNDVEGEGIKGMRQRVEALGGNLQRSTFPGTTLTITLPRTAIKANGAR
jgi:two-component system sensor histidine kinase DesK